MYVTNAIGSLNDFEIGQVLDEGQIELLVASTEKYEGFEEV